MTKSNSRVPKARRATPPRRRLSHQVKMVAVESRRLTPEKIAQLFRLARELESLGL